MTAAGTKATAEQVRVALKESGYCVRIAKDGRVQFRQTSGAWMEGRYVSEYRVIDGRAVIAW